MLGTLPVQEVLQAERFSARRLHHVATDCGSIPALARMAGQSSYIDSLVNLIEKFTIVNYDSIAAIEAILQSVCL